MNDFKIILDSPSEKPALGFDQTALALKEIIEGSKPQFVVGIFGTWGSGKTTLMRTIERKLNPWIYANLFATTFFLNGLQQLSQ